MVDERRIEELERLTGSLAARVGSLEARAAAVAERDLPARPSLSPPPPPQPRFVTPEGRPAPRDPASTARGRVARPTPSRAPRRQPAQPLEEVLGGRVLAWLGGIAILVGLVFFFAYAISHGWIGESERTLIAAGASLGLLCVGVWLHNHRGRTDAALTVVATAVAALFLTITVAAEVYRLIPIALGLALAVGVGAIATALAIRWQARVIGALGMIGALLAPLFVGAPADAATLGFVFVAGLSAVGVLLWQRWDWLGFAVLIVSAPQWVWWLLQRPSVGGALIVLVLFGTVGVVAAIGYELRVPTSKLRASSSFLLTLNAAVLALAGRGALAHLGHPELGDVWVAALAASHLAVGLASYRIPRISADIRLLVLFLGVVLGDVAFGLIADGPVLAVGWAATGLLFAGLARHAGERREDQALVGLGVGGHIGMALLNAVGQASPAAALGQSVDGATAATIALAAVAAGALTSARLTAEGHPRWRRALDALGLGVVGYLTAINFDGTQLVVVWALEAVALARLANLTGDDVARIGAVAFLAGAGLHAFAVEAPPQALVLGAEHITAAAAALAAFAAASLMFAHLKLQFGEVHARPAFITAVAISLLYFASVAIISAYPPGSAELGRTVLDLGVGQQGQMLMSGLWSLAGVIALTVGLRRDWRLLRLGSLGLLLVAVGKVFVYDLSTLDSVYRVGSFMALGLLLLAGAYAYQRLRPRPLPDLRTVPPGVR